MRLYPRIFMACHLRHEPDADSRKGLTNQQEMILGHLDEREPTNLKGLARHMGVTASTMSISVERLVRRALVIRERSNDDRRQILLRLSPTGTRLMESQSVLDFDRVRMLLEALPEDVRADAMRGLAILAEAADRLAAERPKWGPGEFAGRKGES